MKLRVNGVEIEGEAQDVVAYVSLLGAKAPEAPAAAVSSRSERMKKAWAKKKRKATREANARAKERSRQKELARAGITVPPKPVSAEKKPGHIKLKPKKSHHKKQEPRAVPDSHLGEEVDPE